jgi:aminomethyltransferase
MKVSPFYFLEAQAGGTMTEAAWGGVKGYTDAKTEHFAVREKVGVIDFSSMGKFDIKGRDAKKLLQTILVNDLDKLFIGKVLYSTIVNEAGGILDDTTLYLLGEDHYMLVTSTAKRTSTYPYLLDLAAGQEVYITDITGGYGILCLQGPNSVPLLNKITGTSIDDIAYFAYKPVEIAGSEVLLSRTGFTGSRGYELFVKSEDAYAVWNAVLEVGDEFGLQLCGSQVAAASLPLEKGYLSGRELTEPRNPYELGLGWTVALDKAIPSHATEALKKIKADGPANKLVGFILPDKTQTVAINTPVTVNGEEIGTVTSAGFGWYLDAFIGLAYIKAEYAGIGDKITVLAGETPVEVEVVEKIFYDPERKYL